MPGKDREDAMRQNRDDLDTHDYTRAPDGDEAQVREQRRHRNEPHPGQRKPKFGGT